MVDSNAMRKTFVVPDIKPLDQYDLTRARICASVGWLLAKSYGNAGIIVSVCQIVVCYLNRWDVCLHLSLVWAENCAKIAASDSLKCTLARAVR